MPRRARHSSIYAYEKSAIYFEQFFSTCPD
jgi:hypothetical protein